MVDKKKKKATILERKLRYFFTKISDSLTLEGLEILMLGEFDGNNKLVLDTTVEETKKLYNKYWKKLQSK